MPPVTMPNGDVVSFPDDMPSEQIKGLIASKFPQETTSLQPKAPNVQKLQEMLPDDPNKIYGSVLPISKDVTTGHVQLAVPGFIRDLVHTAELPGKVTAGEATPEEMQTGATNLAMMLALGKSPGAQNVASKAAPGLGDAATALAEQDLSHIPPPAARSLPPELSNLTPVMKADEGILPAQFKKSPNPLEVGLKANNQISASYDADLLKQRTLYGKLDQIGGQFDVKAPELYAKLDEIIDSLKDQVLPGTKEHTALSNLSEIRDNLQTKYSQDVAPVMGDQFGQVGGGTGVTAYGVSPSDLVDIKTALNSGLNTNKFTTAGSGRLLMFKNYVSDALKNASDISPEFGKALREAETQAARVGQYKSESLKPFWQPEDYVAYRAKINNPAHPGVTDATVNRANNMLDNLNSPKAAGRANAVVKVLGPQKAEAIFKHAITHGKKNAPSVGKALIQTATLHPLAGAKTLAESVMKPKEVHLSKLAKNLKKMSKK